jgi:hypothetical protein
VWMREEIVGWIKNSPGLLPGEAEAEGDPRIGRCTRGRQDRS